MPRLCCRNPREFLAGGVDKSVSQILKFSVPFDAPGKELRQQLWRKLVPAKTPIDADVDYEYLASRFDFVGSSIHSAIFKVRHCGARFKTKLVSVPGVCWCRAC